MVVDVSGLAPRPARGSNRGWGSARVERQAGLLAILEISAISDRAVIFVAYPAQYRSSGVMTFVSSDDVVFQKDLGPVLIFIVGRIDERSSMTASAAETAHQSRHLAVNTAQ
jgi:hypothetical protein